MNPPEHQSGPLWSPDPRRAGDSAMARFWRSTRETEGLQLESYDDLWTWSVDHPERFWPLVGEFFGVRAGGAWTPVRDSSELSGAGWFPELSVNYTAQVFAGASRDRPALVIAHEDTPPVEMPWAELRAQVGAVAARLRSWGVRPGDRVAAYLPNSAEAVVALLATAAVGAVWSCCAPDYGVDAVVDRFAQIEPRVLLVTAGYSYAGRRADRSDQAAAIAARLPSVTHVVQVGDAPPKGWLSWADVVGTPADLVTEEVPFAHPLWILYSSGTTGLPKGIVHSHGGIVLEHLKWLGLHNDMGPGDRLFWFSSTAWMVWNVTVSSLMLGATVVVYDGSPTWPDKDALWRLAARTRATYFGTSAGYLTASQRGGLEPGRDHDLSALRCVMSSGSPLPIPAWHWVYEHVKPDVWLDAPSGGTDVCTPYVGGSPLAPVHAGEMQCRLLGTRVEAWREDGTPVIDEVGELVVTAAMPSMPVMLWNDPNGRRYQDTYFDVFPGVWRHGDWLTVTGRGTAIVHGRSDSTINRHGVRLGSADIYTAVEGLPEVADCLVIGAELTDGGYWMPLFVVPAACVALDDALRGRINDAIRRSCSARHVPDEIIEVPAVPHTLTGKRLEVPVKRLLQGVPPARAVNAGVVDRPDVLDFFVRLGQERHANRGNA
ncbi:acetoacetyl-CoA synthetase [Geodermatophilus africanus]|uniref:Acetoacetyl-CoA synthetase n=1 Tax=Geodermatophilus africanus TaxID=1137993 RepID=A0A1H3QIU2_9ACTN|nr:acetoacetate--CoA ligase [Geodermatophilus africanus]SDZ13524.1 acetoacetyl-CoA synthetase [Geodermatophilus africanus]